MKSSQAQPRWWDWPAIGLLFLLLHVVASRLVTTDWTVHLSFTQTLTSMGFSLGLALGYSQFQRRTARWLSFLYMIVILPLIWIRIFDKQVELEERFLSIGGRLWYSIGDFFARRPVEDPLFFVSIMCVVFWIISASAGFNLVRHQNFLRIVLPSAIGLLVIQHYDNIFPARLWFLAFFTFIALCLLGRLNFLQNQRTWRERRIFLSPETSIDLSTSMAITSAALIIMAWLLPLSFPHSDSVRKTWQRLTRPWTDFTERMHNAVSALSSPSPGSPGEFYGTELQLGRGFPLSDALMFSVQIPDLGFDQAPPRYYWRGRTYDYFSNDQWYTTGTTREQFSPTTSEITIADTNDRTVGRFIVTLGASRSSLLYSPSQPIWFSRPGSYLAAPADTEKNIMSWNASPSLQAGETYQVDVALNNPHVEELRDAGTEYPKWVTDKYLQMPKDFSPRIQELAQQITANLDTPYEKTLAVTRYLRDNLQYAPTIPDPPRRKDPLEWVLFEYKQAYCVYYATSEVLMLRSVGIPARMAVGFSQGIPFNVTINRDGEDTVQVTYSVIKKNAHAWPEVYFPSIGWVEFEPTAGQTPLTRPFLPNDAANPGAGLNSRAGILSADDLIPPPNNGPSSDINIQPETKIPPSFYLILSLMAFAALIIYLNRRYNLPVRVPGFVRTTMERTGIEVPRWIIRWEGWVSLTPIEKSFDSINFGLRRVKQPAPAHATPEERANNLANILPHLSHQIKVLLDEHQTSLYTSRVADEKIARHAARQIRIQVLISILRHILTGHYEVQVAEPEP